MKKFKTTFPALRDWAGKKLGMLHDCFRDLEKFFQEYAILTTNNDISELLLCHISSDFFPTNDLFHNLIPTSDGLGMVKKVKSQRSFYEENGILQGCRVY